MRWSPCASMVPPSMPVPPCTTKPSSVASMSAPSPFRPSTVAAMRSRLLHPQLLRRRVTTVSPSAKQPSSATSGSSSIASGTSSASTVVRLERGLGDVDVADRLGGPAARADRPRARRSPPRPCARAIRKKPVRVQFSAIPEITTRAFGTMQAAAAMKAALEGSPGTSTRSSSSSSTCEILTVRPSRSNGARARARMRSVWSRESSRLGDRRLAGREHAGDQHARLHLRARDRQRRSRSR